ncbi:MAG: right-handed parallel beta-helix repeat-containing protein [Sedimentisphaerales bacterium]|nr:right-handed parallel beta-helix repeat-containing protein [Sedimentisphaerales bacterium]
MRRIVLQTLLAASLVVVSTSVAVAQRVIYVAHDVPADFNTIQAAIDGANDGDVVVVAPGIYTGDGNRDIDFKGKAITVKSEAGPETCVIDCQGSPNEPHRGFYFHSSEDANSVVRGFTVTGGFAVGDDSVTAAGGGILCDASSPYIANCIVTGNVAVSGAGIACIDSNSVITRCVVSGNDASPPLVSWGYPLPWWKGAGGGIRIEGTCPMVINCLVAGNRANRRGGGISCAGNFVIRNCTVSGNRARDIAGGLITSDWSGHPVGVVIGCIIWDNTAASCTQITPMPVGFAGGGTALRLRYCTVQDIDLWSCMYGSQDTWTSVEPVFANPGYWDPNGTPDDPDDDFWVDGDYHLKSQGGRWDPIGQEWVMDDVTSPCIDAGDPTDPVADEPEPNGGRGNLGAYGGTTEASRSYFPDPGLIRIIYVDDDATGADNGSSWLNAYRHLQDALADASTGPLPVEIHVAQGCYQPDRGAAVMPDDREATFHLAGGITLRGGYAGVGAPDPNARDVGLYRTVLSGDLEGNDAPAGHPLDLLTDSTRADNSYTIVTMARYGYFSGVLDGLTVSSATGGPALLVSLPHASIQHCTFIDNACGAVVVDLGDARVEFAGSRFVRNATTEGGAINTTGGRGYPNPAAIIVNGCTFTDNHATDIGGAVLLHAQETLSIRHCTFAGNSAGYGGAVCLDTQAVTDIANCLFAGNRAAVRGGAIYLQTQSVHVGSCTFADNRAEDEKVVGSERGGNPLRVTIVSSILRNGSSGLFGGRGGLADVTYSSVEGGRHGEGNIDVDPLFADPGHWDSNATADDPNDDFWVDGDYHLKSQAGRWDPHSQSWVIDEVTSPCTDAGDQHSPIGLEPFPNGGRINMGAYGGTAEASMSPFFDLVVLTP